jgi:hypothetical protein
MSRFYAWGMLLVRPGAEIAEFVKIGEPRRRLVGHGRPLRRSWAARLRPRRLAQARRHGNQFRPMLRLADQRGKPARPRQAQPHDRHRSPRSRPLAAPAAKLGAADTLLRDRIVGSGAIQPRARRKARQGAQTNRDNVTSALSASASPSGHPSPRHPDCDTQINRHTRHEKIIHPDRQENRATNANATGKNKSAIIRHRFFRDYFQESLWCFRSDSRRWLHRSDGGQR